MDAGKLTLEDYSALTDEEREIVRMQAANDHLKAKLEIFRAT